MFIRYSVRRINGKTYRYPQLVEAYRNSHGAAVHRVLCTLTSLSDQTLANISTALEAGRNGKPVLVAPPVADVFRSVGVLANLRYLDIAVAFEQWQKLQLHSLLAELLADSQADVPPADVVCALVLHRCTDPDSKLAAVRWYPKTALPELQGIPPARFHNTRVHRALEALERVESKLQARLAQHLGATQGNIAFLFLDITDTWFEGRGPMMACNARTKEGVVREKVGVVLLCDQRGYPLRWQTLPGNYYEADAMQRMVEGISTLDWVYQVPIVMDRMMGKAGALARLSESGVRFVTALPVTEFESWTPDIPWQPLAEVTVAGTASSAKEDMARILTAVKRTGMVNACGDRWLLDLGVVTRTDLGARSAPVDGAGTVVEALRVGASMKADLDARVARGPAELAQRRGICAKSVQRYLKLAQLAPDIQRRVLAGEAEMLPLRRLCFVARQPVKKQQAAFDALLKQARRSVRVGRRPNLMQSSAAEGPGVSIRLVVGFKPEAYRDERKKALETRREVEAFVEDLNRRLRSPHSHRAGASIYAEVDRFLRGKECLSLFKVTLEGEEPGEIQVKLQLDEEAWAKRRRYDGFNLFAAHPDIPMAASAIVETYYAKDVVEKGFQTIKSELELRPVRHRTDSKVRAHVTICMLALLLERQLERDLRDAGRPMTAPALLDTLESVHLNRLRIGSTTAYTVTERDPDVTEYVTALGMQHLVDDELVSQRIHPRGICAS